MFDPITALLGSKELPEIPGPENIPPDGVPVRVTAASDSHILDGKPEKLVCESPKVAHIANISSKLNRGKNFPTDNL